MATANSGLLAKVLTRINEKTKRPINALAVGAAAAALIACFPQFTMEIANTGSFCSAITLIVNRKKGMVSQGSFVVPGGYTVPVITLVGLLVTLTQLKKAAYVLSAGWYAIGLVIFIIAMFLRKDEIQKL